jgi:carbonic anhydrase
MSAQRELEGYIRQHRETYTREAIDANLAGMGHSQDEIDRAWASVEGSTEAGMETSPRRRRQRLPLGMAATTIVLSLSMISMVFGPSCRYSSAGPNPTRTPMPTPTRRPLPTPPWSYEGDTGPDTWGQLRRDYETCERGTQQSPIDISASSEKDEPNIAYDFAEQRLTLGNDGRGLGIEVHPLGWLMEIGGMHYMLKELRFHRPSEHTIGGHHSDAELQYLYEHEEGSTAAVAVLLKVGAENSTFTRLMGHVPEVGGRYDLGYTNVLPAALAPILSRTTYRYTGSLTTPPCTEGVEWFVMTEPVEISAEQLATLASVSGPNNRPVQPLNGRVVVKDVSP